MSARRHRQARFNPDHKRFYTSGSLLAELEESLPVAGFRVRSLREIDTGFDYSLAPDQHAKGCYDIELVVQKLSIPKWASVLTLSPAGQLAIETYVDLILDLARREPALAIQKAQESRELVASVPLPPFAILASALAGSVCVQRLCGA